MGSSKCSSAFAGSSHRPACTRPVWSMMPLGLWSDEPKDIASARRVFEAEIRPNILELDEVIERVEEAMEDAREDDEDEDDGEGVCIQCGDGDDDRKWARYGDEDCEDNDCHGCGDAYPATMRKPLCRDCYW
ncbi:hypothetical protein STIAU_5831 [Stigmatella aurantiaca DW4/3-1]|nr:hypothetical protein STIAU_5831 [Stigmatella aurantiaca DW4/3-1]